MGDSDDGTIAWRELLGEATERLTAAGVADAAREARWLVEEASGNVGAEWATGLDELATVRGVAHLDAMVARREGGEPIQYVLGHWAFRRLDLMVDRRVLIPRPETEVLVDVVLAELDRQRGDDPLVAADLGTGSGAIALALATEAPDVAVVGVERSRDALVVARANLAGLGTAARRVRLVEGSWFEPLAGHETRFHAVAANPPYVATVDELPDEVRNWEPAEALLSGDDGLDDARHLLAEASRWLVPGGAMVLELDPRQMEAASDLARAADLVDVEVVDDLAGRARVLRARRRP